MVLSVLIWNSLITYTFQRWIDSSCWLRTTIYTACSFRLCQKKIQISPRVSINSSILAPWYQLPQLQFSLGYGGFISIWMGISSPARRLGKYQHHPRVLQIYFYSHLISQGHKYSMYNKISNSISFSYSTPLFVSINILLLTNNPFLVCPFVVVGVKIFQEGNSVWVSAGSDGIDIYYISD